MSAALTRPINAFFALLREIERQAPYGARVGERGAHPEPVHLKHDPSLAFPTAEVVSHVLRPAYPVTLTCSFLGLTGTTSPLPEHLTEGWSQADEEGPLHALFDVWHHRLLSLLYRSVSKYSPSGEGHIDGRDAWTQRLLSWSPSHCALPLAQRLRGLPYLAQKQNSATGLLAMVRDHLAAQVRAEAITLVPMCGGWQPLCEDQQFRLGERNHSLAHDAWLGSYVNAPASAFEVHVGPLNARAYGWTIEPPRLTALHALLQMFSPPGTEAVLIVELEAGAHPGWPEGCAQLGLTTWLGPPEGPVRVPWPDRVDENEQAA